MNNRYLDTAIAIMSAVYIQREMKALIALQLRKMYGKMIKYCLTK